MSKLKIFLILSGYQLTWLMCVFGELLYKSFLPGLICGLIFIFISFLYANNKIKFAFIIFSISIPGYLFDSVLVFFNVYNFDTSFSFGFLPIWMLILWPSFASLFDEVFIFLSKYKVAGVLISSILGPLTYYTGYPLGLIEINEFNLFSLFMISFWALLMFYYLNFLIKFKFD